MGIQHRVLGTTGLSVTSLCFGTSGLGSLPAVYGYAVDDATAAQTLKTIFDSPINHIDTANCYGQSEQRIGRALAEMGGLPKGFVLSTKADPDPQTGEYSAARVRVSIEQSLERLGLDHLQLVYLHDPEKIGWDQAMDAGGPVEGLVELQQSGVIDHLGVGGSPVDLMRRFAASGHFEVILTHNRYTLLERSAEPLIADCHQAGIAVINGAPFGSGILGRGPKASPMYAYRRAPDEVLLRAERLQADCEAFGVPLAAAALQFSMRDPRIASTLVGVTKAARIASNIDLANWPIPAELWDRLEPVTAAQANWLAWDGPDEG